jgi:hypothetical protein
MNVVSFALYGNLPKYTAGAIRNAAELENSTWQAVFYCGKDVNEETIRGIQAHGGIIIKQEEDWHINGMFWRYYAISNPDFARIIFRDVDSRISVREWMMISDWVKSNKPFHIIRDHPAHLAPILGGLWGTTKKISEARIDWQKMQHFGDVWGEDQRFLKEFVYPGIRKEAFVHDSFFRYEYRFQRIGYPRESGEYSGESVEEDGSINNNLRSELIEVEGNYLRRMRLKIASVVDLFRILCR